MSRQFPWDFIKNSDWQYLVNRKETYLCKSLIDGCDKYRKIATGLNWKNRANFRLGNGDILLLKSDVEALTKEFEKASLSEIEIFNKKLVKQVGDYARFAKLVGKKDLSKITQDDLLKILDAYLDKGLRACCFLNPIPVLDKIISQRILKMLEKVEGNKQEYLGILTYPAKENSHTEEARSFYNLIKNVKSKKFSSILQRHLADYAWIGARGYWWSRAWNEQFILDRHDDFVRQGKNPDKELKQLSRIRRDNLRAFNHLIQNLGLSKSSESYKIISIAKELAYLRTWRTDLIYGAGYDARNLFFEIARRANFPADDLSWINIDELRTMAQSSKSSVLSKEIKRRKAGITSIATHNKFYIATGLANIKKAINLSRQNTQANKFTVQGNSVFKGKVTAKVRVVMTGLDLKNFKTGEVLVSVMTFPNFVPAMEKASAFVTDEGGILCHAAIIAREMKKPCVIATKLATKVFKTGDLVEVDANQGIVRLVSSGKLKNESRRVRKI